MAIVINNAGVHATIQDLGRTQAQKYGIPVSGAMDAFALRIANLLVKNIQDEACLEVMFYGTAMTFKNDHVIAITGADLQPMINNNSVPMWRPIFVKNGATLRFKGAKSGCFAYVAVAGGFDVPQEIGSKSTYTRANIGGYEGRAVEKGDEVHVGAYSEKNDELKRACLQDHSNPAWYVNDRDMYEQSKKTTVRVMKGNEYDSFTDESLHAFTSETFKLTTEADRMGYTFTGPTLQKKKDEELLSEGVTYGTVQVPASGNPIILMADRQTTGGYFKIGQVISADFPRLAQLQPGSDVTFVIVSIREAERALFMMEEHIREVSVGIDLKIQSAIR